MRLALGERVVQEMKCGYFAVKHGGYPGTYYRRKASHVRKWYSRWSEVCWHPSPELSIIVPVYNAIPDFEAFIDSA